MHRKFKFLLSAAVYKVHDYHIALQPIAVGLTQCTDPSLHHIIPP